MSIANIVSKIRIPYKNVAYGFMLCGLVLLFCSFHLVSSVAWLPYASVGMLTVSILYLCYFVFKAGYKKAAITNAIWIIFLCVFTLWLIHRIQPMFMRL